MFNLSHLIILQRLGDLYYHTGQYSRSLEVYLKLLQQDSDNIYALSRLAFQKIVSRKLTIQGLMFHHLDYLGLIRYKNGMIDKDRLNYRAIFKAIDNRFNFHFKKLTFSDEVLSREEIGRIKIQQKKGVALNKDVKSLGPPSSDNLLRFLIQCVSFGLDPFQIAKAFAYQGVKIAAPQVIYIIKVHLGGIGITREKFFFPIVKALKKEAGLSDYKVASIFMDAEVMWYIDAINKYFRAGYSVKKIVNIFDLGRKCPNVDDIVDAVKQALILSNIDKYTEGMSFTDFKYAILKESFLKAIKNGATDYSTLNILFKGFKSKAHIVDIFLKAFNGRNLESVFYHELSSIEQNRIIALQLIRAMKRDQRFFAVTPTFRARVLTYLRGIISKYEPSFHLPRLRESPIPLAHVATSFEELTGSSWNELYGIAIEYSYQSYLDIVLKYLELKAKGFAS